ncbi:hypothetical protein [Ruminococcus flavefaciens]|nr:hypothetical protein [Ruminococcus flavefaciens]
MRYLKGKAMKILNALLRLAASEILCIFIDITFAASGNPFIKFICLVCTVLLMIFVLADFSVKAARADIKFARMSGETVKAAGIFAAGAAVTVPPLVSWIVLYISAKGGSFDYYRWHKLLNAAFLQLYNLINSSANSSDLTGAELAAMLVPVIVPAMAVIIPYMAVCGRNTDK